MRTWPDFVSVDRGVEQLLADGHQAVEEVGVQRLEATAVRLQRVSEPVLRDQEINEEADPLTQCRDGRAAPSARPLLSSRSARSCCQLPAAP